MTDRIATVAAVVATAVLGLVALVHLYWAVGGTWALHALGRVDTPVSSGAKVFFAAVAVLAVVTAFGLLAAVGAVRLPVARRLLWALASMLVVGGVLRASGAPAVGVTALVLGLLCAAVVAFGRPVPGHRSLRSRR